MGRNAFVVSFKISASLLIILAISPLVEATAMGAAEKPVGRMDYYEQADKFAPHAKEAVDRYLRSQGYNTAQLTGAVFLGGGAFFRSDWQVHYWYTPPEGDYPAGEKSDIEVDITRDGSFLIFKRKEAEADAQVQRPMVEYVAKEQLKKLGVNLESVTYSTELYILDLEKTWWKVKAWLPPAPSEFLEFHRGDYEFLIDSTGKVLYTERLTNGQRYTLRESPKMETLYDESPNTTKADYRPFPLYELPPAKQSEFVSTQAGELQKLRDAASTARPTPSRPDARKAKADAFLQQQGYDPFQYRSMLWYWGEWRVDYWPVTAPVNNVQDPYVPPSLIFHFGKLNETPHLEIVNKELQPK